MNKRVLIVLMIVTTFCYADDVYKCQLSAKKTVYQSVPCPNSALKQSTVNIDKINPEEQQQALENLKNIEKEQAVKDKAAREQAEQRRLMAKQEKSQQKSTTVIVNNPYPVYIPYPSYGYRPIYRPGYYPQNPTLFRSPALSDVPHIMPAPTLNPPISPYRPQQPTGRFR